MKINSNFLKSLLVTALAFIACTTTYAKEKFSDSIENDKSITRTYDVSKGFHAINSDIIGNIIFVQTAEKNPTLKITAPEEYLKQIEVTVKNGVLTLVGKDKNLKIKRNKSSNIQVCISGPQLDNLKMMGVGNFNANEGLKSSDLSIESTGVGNININNIDCNNATVFNSSIGNVKLSGTANKVVLKSDGVGGIVAENLKAKSVVATCDGVGNITCYATEKLNASMNGVGSIKYKGNPKEKEFKKDGIGSIKSM